MSWIQIKLDSTAEQAEHLEDSLLELGACAVTLQDACDQPLYEPELGTTPLWNQTRIIGLFDAATDMDSVVEALKASAADHFSAHRVEIVEDKDWEREWMVHFHPMKFGQRLWICPSWKDVPDPDGVNLMLDPGLAFGTGTHPTTALCLEWLESLNIENQLVVDYGCGSGILGIASLLLGASRFVGVDTDPQALEASTINAERNHISHDRFDVHYPDATPAIKADVMVANILAGPLTSLAPTLAELTRSGGHLALSGILAEQAEAVSEAYSEWFTMSPPVEKEGWVRLDGIRK
ncbi:50S ribosomal protein L11 methyltransferase [Kistimonas scapharcae]|uniref:Ribosomal protein L11 methyltransferase n=1 Tax=Kistimonas scapharcae TaxID=1036133 RepID=A0ABP8UXF8_9GAMM